MFDRFTDRARTVLGLARKEAGFFNHHYIGTEHFLLGLLQEGKGVAANVLRDKGVTYEIARAAVREISQDGPTMVSMGQLPFTPRAKRCLEIASEAAVKMRHNYIGTEHLLLGVIGETGGIGFDALKALEVDFSALEWTILDAAGLNPTEIEAPAGSCEAQDNRPTDPLPELAGEKFEAYQEFTQTTAVYPEVGSGSFSAVSYCTLGLVGETGEVAEKIKKRYRLGGRNAFLPNSVVTYKKTNTDETYEEFVAELTKEIGDVLWYAAGLAAELGISFSDVAEANVAKLSSRKKRGVLKGSGDNR